MSHLSPIYISDAYAADIVRRKFSVNQDIALAVAMAESGLNINAHNDSGEDSRGIWQINVEPTANPQYASWNLYDPEVCAQAALEVSSSGTYWCPWSVFEEACGVGHTGGYRAFLARARAALNLPPPPLPHQHYAASNLHIDPFWETQCVISTQFRWTRGSPDITAQRLDLAVYPFSWEQGISFDIPVRQSSIPFTGFVPKAGYYWRIVSFFADNPELYSLQHEFIVPGLLASCFPDPPEPPPWPYIPPDYIPSSNNLYAYLAAGIFVVGMVALASPRKKIIIKKKVKK